jgi:hypothetical protein
MTVNESYAKHGKWIHTQVGRFYFDEPEFKPEAIAHALAMLVRYNGHVSTFYSVAEHSMLVAGLMQELNLGDPFEGLMHDAAEAYFRDISAPWKQLVPDSVAIEDHLDRLIREKFNLPVEKTDGCDYADKLALFIESYYLMPDRGSDFADIRGVRPRALELVNEHWKVHGFDPKLGKLLWIKGYEHFGPKIQIAETANVAVAAQIALAQG